MSSSQSRSASHARLEHPQLAPYAPVIERAVDEVQVGIDPATVLVFRGGGFGRLLKLLNGSRPTSAVKRSGLAAGLTIDQVTGALEALAAAGLLTERGSVPYQDSLASLQVRLIGAGVMGYQLARLLLASGLETLYVYDDEPPDLTCYPAAGVLSSRAEALRSALADAGARISALSHWSKPETAQLDLTVVACDRPEPDRVITDHLVRNDQPHLLLRCSGNGVSVGPLVVQAKPHVCVAPTCRAAMQIRSGRPFSGNCRDCRLTPRRRCLPGPPRSRRLRRWHSCTVSCRSPLAQQWSSAGLIW